MIKIHTKRKNKEFGIKKRKTLFGRKINKIKVQKMRKEKKPINNGLKNPSLAYQKLGRLKMNNKQVRRKKIG